jgi:putative transcriptional regulator
MTATITHDPEDATPGQRAAETKRRQREAMRPGQKAAQTKRRKAAALKARQTMDARRGAVADTTARRERLVAARHARGLSQSELARRVGVTKSSILRYEGGDLEPTVTVALAIAKVLRSSVERLFDQDVRPMTAGQKAAAKKAQQREAMTPGQKAQQTKNRKAAAAKAKRTREAREMQS